MTTTMYFHTSPTCASCKVIKPIARKIAAQYDVDFVEMDVSRGQAVVADILSVPTVVVVQNSGVVGRLDANYVNGPALRKMLERVV